MYTVRCSICFLHLRSLKSLTIHYLRGHSKLKIIRQLLEVSISHLSPVLLKHGKKRKLKNKPKKLQKKIQYNPESLLTETFYLNDNIRILCGQNEIIIGDNNSDKVDMEFSFDQSSLDCKENYYISLNDDRNVSISTTNDCPIEIISSREQDKQCSPSASSEDSTTSLIFKRKTKRKKVEQRNMKHYCIDITKLQDLQSLDDQNGYFYICNCREKFSEKPIYLDNTDSRIITSDTESCSDSSKNSSMAVEDSRVFCSKCGSGYKTKVELEEHMNIHKFFCRLCSLPFLCEFTFKQHMQLHIFRIFVCHICYLEFPFREMLLSHFDCHAEDHTFETILDMEEEYKIYRYNFASKNYHNSINSIICFLSERPDIYYCSSKFMKIICDMCFTEIYLYEYDRHLQTFHNC